MVHDECWHVTRASLSYVYIPTFYRSIGATVVEMLKAEPPWYEYEPTAAMFKIVTDVTEPNLPPHCSEHAFEFVSRCFVKYVYCLQGVYITLPSLLTTKGS